VNLLLVRGYPRQNGYTHAVTELFARGAREAGARVTDIHLSRKVIRPCNGCYRCWIVTPGACVHHDDMPSMLEALLESDVIVLSSPLYHFAMSASMKTFLERTLPLTSPGIVETPSGRIRNHMRYPGKWKKSLIVIMACAFKDPETFSAARKTFEHICEGMDISPGGFLLRPESYLLQFALAKPKTVKIIETAFVKAGYEAARQGRLSEETQRNAASPLTTDLPHFLKYSNIFWEHAARLGAEAMDLEKLRRAVTGDVRVLLSEMVRSIDPAAAARTRAVLQFDFSDSGQHFTVAVDKGRATLTEGESADPDLRIVTTAGVWAGLFMREIDARTALVEKKIVLTGDKSIFARLDRYFPPPDR